MTRNKWRNDVEAERNGKEEHSRICKERLYVVKGGKVIKRAQKKKKQWGRFWRKGKETSEEEEEKVKKKWKGSKRRKRKKYKGMRWEWKEGMKDGYEEEKSTTEKRGYGGNNVSKGGIKNEREKKSKKSQPHVLLLGCRFPHSKGRVWLLRWWWWWWRWTTDSNHPPPPTLVFFPSSKILRGSIHGWWNLREGCEVAIVKGLIDEREQEGKEGEQEREIRENGDAGT